MTESTTPTRRHISMPDYVRLNDWMRLQKGREMTSTEALDEAKETLGIDYLSITHIRNCAAENGIKFKRAPYSPRRSNTTADEHTAREARLADAVLHLARKFGVELPEPLLSGVVAISAEKPIAGPDPQTNLPFSDEQVAS